MKTWIVKWEIEVDAENELEAAMKAREIQRDPASIATVFEVEEYQDVTLVDLSDFSVNGEVVKTIGDD